MVKRSVGDKDRRFHNADITSKIGIGRRSACDLFDDGILAKPFLEEIDKLFSRPFVQIPQHSIQSNAVHVYVERVFLRRRVYNLQRIAAAALRQRALPIGRFHAVEFAKDGEGKPAVSQPALIE